MDGATLREQMRKLISIYKDLTEFYSAACWADKQYPSQGSLGEMVWAMMKGGTLHKNRNFKGYDVYVVQDGVAYRDQVKVRKGTGHFRQLDLSGDDTARAFDRLIAVVVDSPFEVQYAFQIPYGVVKKHGRVERDSWYLNVSPTTWNKRAGVLNVTKEMSDFVHKLMLEVR